MRLNAKRPATRECVFLAFRFVMIRSAHSEIGCIMVGEARERAVGSKLALSGCFIMSVAKYLRHEIVPSDLDLDGLSSLFSLYSKAPSGSM